MRITRIETFQIETPRYYGYVSGHVIINRLKLKSIDLSHRFKDWESGVRYADALRHHDPFHFEGPSHSMRINAEFTRRMDLPVSEHIHSFEQGHEAVERGSCTIFNVACITYGPTYIRRLFSLAECTGLKCLIGTDQESTLGSAAQLSVAVTVPDLDPLHHFAGQRAHSRRGQLSLSARRSWLGGRTGRG